MELLKILKLRKGNLLPENVKKSFKDRFVGRREKKSEPEDIYHINDQKELLNWIIESMPEIAKHHKVPLYQVLDSIQHYRFGFLQAKRLLASSNSVIEEDIPLALFTSVHDIGRMMVGSGASKFVYSAKETNLLHPIAGAEILREAFLPLSNELSKYICDLMISLINITERHLSSIGLHYHIMEQNNIDIEQIRRIDAYKTLGISLQKSLLLVDSTRTHCFFRRFVHLISLADLINNVSAKLEGVDHYDPIVDLNNFSVEERINYIINGPGEGQFKVQKDGKIIEVIRFWKSGQESGISEITRENFADCLRIMASSATRVFNDAKALIESQQAFWEGADNAFSFIDSD